MNWQCLLWQLGCQTVISCSACACHSKSTATLFLLALSAGKLAASLSRALLYLSGSITTPGVFRILGRVRFLRQVDRRPVSSQSQNQGCASFGHTLACRDRNRMCNALDILGLSP